MVSPRAMLYTYPKLRPKATKSWRANLHIPTAVTVPVLTRFYPSEAWDEGLSPRHA